MKSFIWKASSCAYHVSVSVVGSPVVEVLLLIWQLIRQQNWEQQESVNQTKHIAIGDKMWWKLFLRKSNLVRSYSGNIQVCTKWQWNARDCVTGLHDRWKPGVLWSNTRQAQFTVISCTPSRFHYTVEPLWKRKECLTKVAKFGPFPCTILYKSCLSYPSWQATSFEGHLGWPLNIDVFQCIFLLSLVFLFLSHTYCLHMKLKWLLLCEFHNILWHIFTFFICFIAFMNLSKMCHSKGCDMVMLWWALLLLCCYGCDSIPCRYDVTISIVTSHNAWMHYEDLLAILNCQL